MKNAVIALVVILVLGGGAYALTRGSDQTTEDATTNTTEQTDQASTATEQPTADTESGNTLRTTVAIENFAYSPATITVKKGTTITWTNNDSVEHTVTSDEGTLMNSEMLAKGSSYSVAFNETGTYAYHCQPHPNMKATVVVTE